VAAAGEIIDNRTVGAVIPRTRGGEIQQLLAHRPQAFNMAFDFRDLL